MFHPNVSNVGRDVLKICIIHDEAVEVTHFMFTPRAPLNLNRPVLFEILCATDTGVKGEEESKPKLEVTDATRAVAQHVSRASQLAPAPVTPIASLPLWVASPAPQKATETALLTPISPYAMRAGEASVPARNATPDPSESSFTSKVRKLASPRTRRARTERFKKLERPLLKLPPNAGTNAFGAIVNAFWPPKF